MWNKYLKKYFSIRTEKLHSIKAKKILKNIGKYFVLGLKLATDLWLRSLATGEKLRTYYPNMYTVMVGIYESTYLLVWLWQAVVEGSLVEILDE